MALGKLGSLLNAAGGATIAWSGDLIVPIAISNFRFGTFTTTTIFDSTKPAPQPGNYYATLSDPFVLSVVPEPSPIALAGIGLAAAGLATYRRRRAMVRTAA